MSITQFTKAFDDILLKSENAIKLGKVHCTILAADTLFMEEAGIIDKVPPVVFEFRSDTLTPFGHETSGHFIQWWVKKNAQLNLAISLLR